MFHTFSYQSGFIHLAYEDGKGERIRAQIAFSTRSFKTLKAAKRWLRIQSALHSALPRTL